jgi:Xaa-Pro dipeptidase
MGRPDVASSMRSRVRRIFRELSKPPDAILLANATEPHVDQSFFYATDVQSGTFEGCQAVLFPDGSTHILTHPLEAESARTARECHVEVVTKREELVGKLRDLIPAGTTVGINEEELTYSTFRQLRKALPRVRFVDVSRAIRKARDVKGPDEVARLRQAARIGSRVARDVPSLLRRGMTELELAGEMEYRMFRYGAAGRSFPTIVAFGPHGALPHFHPTASRLRPGMGIVCDFGALHQRYCSDITRSYAFGRPPPELRKIHETVLEAQAAALDTIRAGVPGREPHLAAKAVIDRSPWKGRFTHGLGHSIGLAVHDGYGMGERTEEPLQAGMCVTVEPGIYVPGLGGVRIEDDILVTRQGWEWLSTAPRGYTEVS